MNISECNKLITQLTAISNYAKDIHYNCEGESFYGQHLLSDRINEKLNKFIDLLKEVSILGFGYKPLKSKEYLKDAIDLIPDKIDFKLIREMLIETLDFIQKLSQENMSQGDNNLIGSIAQELQNNLGLLNIMYGET